jgi:hypothetical protein
MRSARPLSLLILIAFSGFLLGGRSPSLRIPVTGELAGQRINTTVDSELARYYLEHYLQNNRTNPRLDSLLDQIHQNPDRISPPSREFLKHLANAYSTDFAALYLARQLLENQANQSMQQAFQAEFVQLKNTIDSSTFRQQPKLSSYVFLFVPGWVYKSQPETGADLAKPREVITKIGLENYLIQIDESGTIEKNANFIAQEIIRHNRLGKKIILVSASSGSASVADALGNLLPLGEAHKVSAWLNIGGLLQGSPLADAAVRGPKRWLVKFVTFAKGWDFASIESMTTHRSRARFNRLYIPQSILVINYVGIPLSGDITKLAKDGYEDLRGEGPNDGLTLITDEIFPGGITIVEQGLDHYFQDKEIDLKTAALAQTIITRLEAKRQEAVER